MKINEDIQITPSPTGYEIRIYNTEQEYWISNMTTEEATRLVEFIFDTAQARKMGIMSVEEEIERCRK